jgi:hypothetical protein
MYADSPPPPKCVYENFPRKFNLSLILISVKKVKNVINVWCIPNYKPIAYFSIKLETYYLIKLIIMH